MKTISKNTTPIVSIITVNYQQAAMTKEFIQSLKSLTYLNTEIIVVDNGSENGKINPYEKYLQGVKLIRSSKNLGFAGGNNLAIKAASGQYLFLVNNDTVLPKDCIEKLLMVFDNNPETGAVSPKIKYFDNPETIQYAGASKVHPITGRNKTIGQHKKDQGQYDSIKETSYAHGAAMMIKSEVISKTGKMPEEFFLYYEELDWSEKIKNAGYKIMYTPTTEILHKESISTGKDSPLKTYYMIKNRILFMRRNQNKIQFSLFILFFSFVSIPRQMISLLFKYRPNHLKAFFKGLKWNFQNRAFHPVHKSLFQL